MTERLASLNRPVRALDRLSLRVSPPLLRLVRNTGLAWMLFLMCLSFGCLVMSLLFRQEWPLSVYLLPLVLAMNVLVFWRLLVLEVFTSVCLGGSLSRIDITTLRLLGVTVIIITSLIITLNTYSRSRLGIFPVRGDSMLIDLRDRLSAQSRLPAMPSGWQAEAVMRSAGGASFSGDFLVAAKTAHDSRLEVVLVDVSGKGLEAGARSLQLSGAFGGLLGSLPAPQFLPAANEYLLRQEWAEGFASAVHLVVDLQTGRFEVRTAGHPPAVQFFAGSGRWAVLDTRGPVLGVVDDARFDLHVGRLNGGDALLLYTDGLVESPDRDIAYGIDKLLGEAQRLVQRGFRGGAEKLVASVRSETDDRALLLLHRS